MRDFAITPSIAVTIGRQTRFYSAYVMTAPAATSPSPRASTASPASGAASRCCAPSSTPRPRIASAT